MNNRIKVLIKIILLCIITIIPLKVASQHYGIATNLYYDTKESCDDSRFYLYKKGLDKPIEKNDIVNFITPITADHFKASDHFVKTIVGMPGDIVEATSKDFFINGQKVANRPLLENIKKSKNKELHQYANDFKLTLKENEYIVLGTNENYSFDSRYWGPIKLENIIGKVIL